MTADATSSGPPFRISEYSKQKVIVTVGALTSLAVREMEYAEVSEQHSDAETRHVAMAIGYALSAIAAQLSNGAITVREDRP